MTSNTQSNQRQMSAPIVTPITNGPGAHSLNDLYHARRFIEFYGKHTRYCRKLEKFLTWNGRHWTPDETGQVWQWVTRAASQAYQADFTSASDHERLRLNKWLARAETCGNIENALKQLRSQPEIIAEPNDFDRDPWLFNVNNGTIDLRTGKLREHRPEDMITKLAPVDFNPHGPQPGLWTNFLNEIFGGNSDLIAFIQRVCGYALTGSVAEQKLFLLHGTGANGKKTFLETLMFVMGSSGLPPSGPDPYSLSLSPKFLFSAGRAHAPEFADLKACRLAAITEVEFNKALAEPTLKKLSGAGRLTFQRARRDRLEFDPSHKLFICANHIFVIETTDHAIWQRISLIPFNITIPEERRDKDLPQKLRAQARGILSWLVAGCLEWQKKGLADPAEVTDATRSYRGEMDLIGAFLGDRCDIAPDAGDKSTDLYSSYTDWCECNDERPLCPRVFGMRLKERGFKQHRTNTYRIWQGLTRKETGW